MSALEAIRQFDGELLWRRLSHLDLLEMWGTGMKGVLSLVMLTVVVRVSLA